MDTHPGLTFLKDAPEFHSRYITTVSIFSWRAQWHRQKILNGKWLQEWWFSCHLEHATKFGGASKQWAVEPSAPVCLSVFLSVGQLQHVLWRETVGVGRAMASKWPDITETRMPPTGHWPWSCTTPYLDTSLHWCTVWHTPVPISPMRTDLLGNAC